jgi:hypothetical protein
VAVNVLGYSPLGFLLALAVMRGTDWGWPVTLASLGAALLSLSMEMLQGFLPSRVPSNLDLALNALGAWLGALAAYLLERLGALQRWGQFRRRWFIGQTRGPLVLLALWPPALLFPLTVPFGLGQVMQQLEEALGSALVGTPFLDWLPVREVELQPMLSGSVVLCVALGVVPGLLLVVLYLVYAGWVAWRQPLRAPALDPAALPQRTALQRPPVQERQQPLHRASCAGAAGAARRHSSNAHPVHAAQVAVFRRARIAAIASPLRSNTCPAPSAASAPERSSISRTVGLSAARYRPPPAAARRCASTSIMCAPAISIRLMPSPSSSRLRGCPAAPVSSSNRSRTCSTAP